MRFVESHETRGSELDFVPREQRNQSGRLILAFVLIIVSILAVRFIPALHRYALATGVLALFITFIGSLIISRYQRNLDLVMHTEFQNLLFTQGLALGCTFCLFVRRDGTITYATDGMYRLLGSSTTESQMLDAVFERGGIPAADRERILEAIYSSSGESLLFTIPEVTDRDKKYVMTVEPLSRPRGHVMVRVREYKDRSGAVTRPVTNVPQEQLLDDTPIGLYATDGYGQFTYVNPVFARLLGYAPREMVASQLTLANVLSALGDRTLSGEYMLDDFKGFASFKTRSGRVIPGVLFQTVLRSDHSKMLNASGSFIPSTLLDMSPSS